MTEKRFRPNSWGICYEKKIPKQAIFSSSLPLDRKTGECARAHKHTHTHTHTHTHNFFLFKFTRGKSREGWVCPLEGLVFLNRKAEKQNQPFGLDK